MSWPRNDPRRYFNMVFFDSYESAMQNSHLPETQADFENFKPCSTAHQSSTTST